MPCHHALAEALHAYIAAAGIGAPADKKAFLFRRSRGHDGTVVVARGANCVTTGPDKMPHQH